MKSSVASTTHVLILLLSPLHSVSAQSIQVTPATVRFTARAVDTAFFPAGGLIININSTSKIPFKFMGVSPSFNGGDVNFVIVSPSSGIAPTRTLVSLNPNIVPFLPIRGYELDLLFAAADQPDNTVKVRVQLTLQRKGDPIISDVLGSATLKPGISPGQAVSIFGTNLSTPPLNGQVSDAGVYPTTLGNTIVTFDGISAPLLYVSNSQINCIVPFGLTAANKSVDVVVSRTFVAKSPAFPVSLSDTAPGLYTVDQSGSGQGVILNLVTGTSATTPNSPANPIARIPGSIITFFATGAGLWNMPFPDGGIVFDPFDLLFAGVKIPVLAPVAPVSLTIGGQPAEVLYAGAAPGRVAGTLQVNARIPEGIGDGAQLIVLKIGQNDNSNQNATVSVK